MKVIQIVGLSVVLSLIACNQNVQANSDLYPVTLAKPDLKAAESLTQEQWEGLVRYLEQEGKSVVIVEKINSRNEQ